jgi:hypothetical protein
VKKTIYIKNANSFIISRAKVNALQSIVKINIRLAPDALVKTSLYLIATNVKTLA